MSNEQPKGKQKRALEEADTEAALGSSPEPGSLSRSDTEVAPSDRQSATGQTKRGDSSQAGESAERLTPGAEIDRFTVIDTIGQGGMGVVLAARDSLLERDVALKLVRPRSRDENAAAHARKRLLREARAMARLSHPNVITVYEAGTVGNQVFIAMELVAGETLRAWQRTPTRDWRELLDRYVLAGRGLAAAHEAELVHRDFKPENVLVGEDGRVCVTDFGLVSAATARARGGDATNSEDLDLEEGDAIEEGALEASLTRTGDVLGTPVYMAPEQHEGKAVDARADQFSFCVALYEALYDQRPFAGARHEELLKNVLAGRLREAPAKTRVPSRVRAVLLRGLRVSPAERYPEFRQLLDDLEDAARARRSSRLRPAAYLAAALLVGLALYAADRSSTKQTKSAAESPAPAARASQAEEKPYSGPGADGSIIFSEDFSEDELNRERWSVFDFTTDHVVVKEISIEDGAVRFDTQATGYALLEESAIRTNRSFDLSRGGLLIEYDHLEGMSRGEGRWWSSYLAISTEVSEPTPIANPHHPSNTRPEGVRTALYFGYAPDGRLFAARNTDGRSPLLHEAAYFETQATGDLHVFVYLDLTNLRVEAGGKVRYDGPHGLDLAGPLHLFFGNYSDQRIRHTARFDNIRVRQSAD